MRPEHMVPGEHRVAVAQLREACPEFCKTFRLPGNDEVTVEGVRIFPDGASGGLVVAVAWREGQEWVEVSDLAFPNTLNGGEVHRFYDMLNK